MTYEPRSAVAACAGWPDLVVELDRWDAAGGVAPFWWRDDDAVTPTPQLDRLLALASGGPLALAVIPAEASNGLVAALAPHPRVAVLQHGWCHANRAGAGKKSEYPAERHPVDVADELDEGRRRLAALFGARAAAMFVPPWNRFAERFVPLLPEVGLIALSRMAPRRGPLSAGVVELDVHVDLVDWHRGRGFVGAETALGRLLAELRARRRGEAERASPIGILTHHLVMDDAAADFVAELAALIDSHRAARWVAVSEMLGAG